MELKKENAKLIKAMENDEVEADKFSPQIKDWYWSSYQKEAKDILDEDKISENVKARHQNLNKYKEPLSSLEHEEEAADKLEEKVNTHIKLLNDKVYGRSISAFADYITWQQEAQLKSPAGKTPLIITNHAYCAGGSYGYRNAFYHVFVDGCAFFGYGNVGSEDAGVAYRQSNVSAWGIKTSLAAGKIVSSLGAEVGFKIPLLYTDQTLDDPNQTTFPNTKAEEDPALMAMASLYARWPIQKWFFQTEFAKVLGKDLTFWGLGIGHTF